MKVTEARRRLEVRNVIRGCSHCGLGDHANRVPFSGPSPARFVVVGEAPGSTEDRKGEPFTGLAGRLMHRMLRSAGLNDTEALFCNAVCCNPWGRAPNRAEMDACRSNLLAQLEIAGCPHLVVAGATALTALVPDGHLRRLHGSVLLVGRWTIVPVYHPSYVLREPHMRPVVVKGLEVMTGLLAGLTADLFRGRWCVLCEHEASVWDTRQMPYCWTHRKEPEKQAKAAKRRLKTENKAAQGRLEL